MKVQSCLVRYHKSWWGGRIWLFSILSGTRHARCFRPESERGSPGGFLGATLQIEITVPVDASGKRLVKADGLGSLVWDGENTLLVTHNHWGRFSRKSRWWHFMIRKANS